MNRHRSPYQIFNTFVEHIKILRDIFRKESNLNFLNAIKKKISNNIVLCAQARVGMHYIAKYLVNIGYTFFLFFFDTFLLFHYLLFYIYTFLVFKFSPCLLFYFLFISFYKYRDNRGYKICKW